MVLPAIRFRARSALEKEAESRIRLAVLVENLVPNFVEEIGKKDLYVDIFLFRRHLCCFFHLWLVLLFFYSTPAEENLAERDNFENFFRTLCSLVETWIWPSGAGQLVSSAVQLLLKPCLMLYRIECWQLKGA